MNIISYQILFIVEKKHSKNFLFSRRVVLKMIFMDFNLLKTYSKNSSEIWKLNNEFKKRLLSFIFIQYNQNDNLFLSFQIDFYESKLSKNEQ